MSLDQKDIELIDRGLCKAIDDIAVSIARSFERLEERIDAMESRLYTRVADIEDRVEGTRQDIADAIADFKIESREQIAAIKSLIENGRPVKVNKS